MKSGSGSGSACATARFSGHPEEQVMKIDPPKNAPITDPVARAASPGTGSAPADGFAALVPEFSVSNLQESLSFWCRLLGFVVADARPAARFAFLVRGPLQVMLCERNGRWESGEMHHPFRRGLNLQMTVESLAPILLALRAADWPLYEQPNEAWYRTGDREGGQREFLVQDPDGYLLRFAENLGTRLPTKVQRVGIEGSR
jgi:catechol 2,3-dioxygenase-like lactoylglutathione lyase family enzyme